MDTKVLEAKFTTQPSMYQNEGDNNHFNENEIEILKQEPEFDERLELNLSEEVNFIENDSEECPIPKNMHRFYFVKIHSFEDPGIKEAEKLIQKMNEVRSQIIERIKQRKKNTISGRERDLSRYLAWKTNDLNHLQQVLDKKLGAKIQPKEVENGLHSSVTNHEELIRSLHRQLLHGSKGLAEEKQLLREIKRLEGTRDTVAANASVQIKGWTMQDQIKHIMIKIGETKKGLQDVRKKIEQAKKEKAAIENDINSLGKELAKVNQTKHDADTRLFKLRKENNEMNACYYQYLSVLINARDLAEKKDVDSLKEFSQNEVEKFMSQWSSNDAFRNDYVKTILPLLDRRELRADGLRKPPKKILRLHRL